MTPIPDTPSKADYPRLSKSMQEVLNIRSTVTADRSRTERLVDSVGATLARPEFFLLLLAGHVAWLVANLAMWPWDPWDPYPFIFLATVASVEAPFIALLILMHQHRNERIAELREEVHLQVSLQVEREVAMALRLMREMQREAGVETAQDPNLLAQMEEDLNPHALMRHVREHLNEIEGYGSDTAP
jgi:uncharacterized membrane protein